MSPAVFARALLRGGAKVSIMVLDDDCFKPCLIYHEGFSKRTGPALQVFVEEIDKPVEFPGQQLRSVTKRFARVNI